MLGYMHSFIFLCLACAVGALQVHLCPGTLWFNDNKYRWISFFSAGVLCVVIWIYLGTQAYSYEVDRLVEILIKAGDNGESLSSCARPRQCCVGGVPGPSLPTVDPDTLRSVSARGQLCPGLRLRRSRCITERKIPPDGGLGLLLFSQGAVPLATANFQYKNTHYIHTKIDFISQKAMIDLAMVVKGECLLFLSCFVQWEGRRSAD